MQFLPYSASTGSQRHRLRGRTAEFPASLAPRFGTPDLLDGGELPCARPGLRRQRRLAPRPEDLYQGGHRCFRRGLARLQRLQPRLRGAPLQLGLELQLARPELKVLLEPGLEFQSSSISPNNRAGNPRQTNGRSPASRGRAESAVQRRSRKEATMAETDFTSVLNVIRSAKQQPVNSASRRAAISLPPGTIFRSSIVHGEESAAIYGDPTSGNPIAA